MRPRRPRGFSLLELTVVVALFAVAAAVAVPFYLRASRGAELDTARNEIANAVRTASQRAATTGTSRPFDLASVVVGTSVVLDPDDVDLPAGAGRFENVTFEGGTGNPIVAGARAAVGVVVAERGDGSATARAIVVTRSAVIVEYRLSNGQWEEVK